MYKQIDAELQKLKSDLFTGYIRFGIEHGDIASMSIASKVEPSSHFIKDLKSEISKFCPEEEQFFGSVEYVITFGNITACNYYITLHGESLKSHLRNTQNREVKQCKNVKVVVKK